MDLIRSFIQICMFCCFCSVVTWGESDEENEDDNDSTNTEIVCDVAYQRQTSSSSIDYDGESCRGVDGSLNQDHFQGSCVHTKNETNPWWEVDFGAEYRVQNIALYVRKDGQEYQHYTQADNIKITVDSSVCNTYYGPTLPNAYPEYIYCTEKNGTQGRVLRITKINNTEQAPLMFCEIKVNAIVADATCPRPTVPFSCGNVSNSVTGSEHEIATVTTDSFISTTTSSTTENRLPNNQSGNTQTHVISTTMSFINGNNVTENQNDATQTPVISTTTSSTTENQNDATQTPIISTTTSPTTGNHVSENPSDATHTPEELSDCLCPCSTLGSNVLMNLTMDEILAKLDEILDDIKVDPKKTSVAIRKRTSAKDNRPSAQTVGYVGMAVLIGIGAGIILLDIDTFIRFLRQIISSCRR